MTQVAEKKENQQQKTSRKTKSTTRAIEDLKNSMISVQLRTEKSVKDLSKELKKQNDLTEQKLINEEVNTLIKLYNFLKDNDNLTDDVADDLMKQITYNYSMHVREEN